MGLQAIRFRSAGLQCAGDLYTPADLRPGEKRPALVIGHGFSLVKEALTAEGKYFSDAGFVTLAIDYRSFGESEGTPRGQLFPLDEVEDYRNAISYLQSRPEVDPERIGIWGTSFAGAISIYTAAVDRRVKAAVSQVPVVNGRRWMQVLRTSEQWLDLLDRLDEDRKRRYETGESARVPVTGVGNKGEFCALPGDKSIVDFFANCPLKTWHPDLSLESIERILEFNPEAMIDRITPRPICIVTTAGWDMVHPLEQVMDAYRKANEPKKIVLLPYSQLELYSEPGRGEAMSHAIAWFDEHLGKPGARR